MPADGHAWVGLGANLGDRHRTLRAAIEALTPLAAGRLVLSPKVESAAWGVTEQPAFLNQVVGFEPRLDPRATLAALQAIEAQLGRKRGMRWGPRHVDLDILFWPGFSSEDPVLTVPHPRISARRFVLEPWARVAPDLLIPGLDRSVQQLLQACADPLSVLFLS